MWQLVRDSVESRALRNRTQLVGLIQPETVDGSLKFVLDVDCVADTDSPGP